MAEGHRGTDRGADAPPNPGKPPLPTGTVQRVVDLTLPLRGALEDERNMLPPIAARHDRFSGTIVPFGSFTDTARKPQGGIMTTLQAVGLGAMLAWTPSLVVLAWMLYDAPLDEHQRDRS
jgi:hypothetical protein